MEIDPALAAELTLLTEALDEPGTDVAESLRGLAAEARAGVASYCGLMVVIARSGPPVVVTLLDDGVERGDIRTSLMLLTSTDEQSLGPPVSLILFATVPGAFVDMAADLSWMTSRALADVILDQHIDLLVAGADAGALQAATVINQAIGMLIGRGFTPEQAIAELDTQASDAGTDRYHAAAAVLTALPTVDEDPYLDPA